MKNLLRLFFSALVLASFVSSFVFTAGSAAAPAQAATGNQAVIRFDMLGLTDTLVRGPYGSMDARFGLPVNWAYKDGASLQLIITANVVSSAAQAVPDGKFIGSTLTVTVNKNDIATIPLLAGNNVTYDVPIPTAALNTPMSDGRHDLSLFLDAGNDCTDTFRHTSIVISSASHFTIPYAEQSPSLDLTQLPRPIFQRDSIFPVNSTMVVPDAPTAGELQAALTIAASFGRMSSGQMATNLVPMSKLSPEMRTGSQLIFVGKSSTLSLLQGVALPSPLQSNKFTAPGMQADDGILQMAVSPWNTGRAMLVVGGNTDAGVIKAAQALSNENIQTIGNPNLAVVADIAAPTVGSSSDNAVPQESRSFADMGYSTLTMSGAGRSDAFVRFNIPPGYTATDDTYLDMTFNHSGLLDFSRSGLTVFMNGNLIGSVLLSQQTATTTTQRIKIPLSSLVTSTNELKFETDLAPLSQCSITNFSNLWLSVLPESLLHMSLKPATAGTVSMRDLGSYPYPFAGDPTLSNLGFILPKNDPSAWNTAAQIAATLGRQAPGALFNLGVAYDGEVPNDLQKTRDLIVIGLPSKMSILGDLNQALPATFEKGTNVAVIKGQQVAYRFPTNSDLGYLELLNSPWNADRTILTVLGTTPAGIAQAGTALINPIMRSRLKGNFVLVNGQSMSVADTRTGLGLASVGDAANVAPQPVNNSQPAKSPVTTVFSDQNGWIPLVVGGLGVMIVIVLIIAALTRRRVTVTRR